MLAVGQVWFFCSSFYGYDVPAVSESNSLYLPDLWWKKRHPLILSEDPGVTHFRWGLQHLRRSQANDRYEAEATAATVLDTAQTPGRDAALRLSLLKELCDDIDLGVESEEATIEDKDTEEEPYPPCQVDIARTIQALVSFERKNKRKRGDVFKQVATGPTRVEEELDKSGENDQTEVEVDETENQDTFFMMTAWALQCDWCRKWRFVSPNLHQGVTEYNDGASGFQCATLRWCDGRPVGLSCESDEQPWQAPNPKDAFAKEDDDGEHPAIKAQESFWAWWEDNGDLDQPQTTEEERLLVYQTYYWEYLADRPALVGSVVPEGFADSSHVVFKVSANDS